MHKKIQIWLVALVAWPWLAAMVVTAQANAETPLASIERCAEAIDKTSQIKFIPLQKSLEDLSLNIFPDQKNNISLLDVAVLKGSCANDVFAVRMSQIEFNDGKVFSGTRDGKFTQIPRIKGLTNLPSSPLLVGPPPIDEAQFVTASKVDSADINNDIRSLDIGIWKKGKSYILAAYTRKTSGAGSPINLITSRCEIKSVTFFPSPDSNSGKITLLLQTEIGPTVVSLNWDHAIISRALYQAN